MLIPKTGANPAHDLFPSSRHENNAEYASGVSLVAMIYLHGCWLRDEGAHLAASNISVKSSMEMFLSEKRTGLRRVLMIECITISPFNLNDKDNECKYHKPVLSYIRNQLKPVFYHI